MHDNGELRLAKENYISKIEHEKTDQIDTKREKNLSKLDKKKVEHFSEPIFCTHIMSFSDTIRFIC